MKKKFNLKILSSMKKSVAAFAAVLMMMGGSFAFAQQPEGEVPATTEQPAPTPASDEKSGDEQKSDTQAPAEKSGAEKSASNE